MKKDNVLLDAFKLGWEPPDNRPIYEWAKQYVDLHNVYSIPGKFDVSRSRYLIEPFHALMDLKVRQINVMASPRCAKTLLGELYMLHTIANNAGTFLWLQSSDEMIDKMSDLRMMPLLRSCRPVANMIDTTDRFSIIKRKYSFSHMTLNLSSAKIRSLQSIGYKFIVGDEVWLWDAGLIGEAQARTIDFQHNSKILLLSQGGVAGDDWDKEFRDGVVYEWGFVCAKCGKAQVLEFNRMRVDGTYGGVIWDRNEVTCKDGKWNYQEAAKTARYECIHCGHQYSDNPQNRRYMNDHGMYIRQESIIENPKKISFRWNALSNIEISFADLCIDYLKAKDAIKYEGNKLSLQEFYQKRLAKCFNNDLKVSLIKILTQEYDPNASWGDYTFMTIDCQNNFQEFYYVIRSWNKAGESRLRKYGRAPSFIELRKIQQDFGIRDQNVLIDSGAFATQVYAKCCEYGHIGVVGGRKMWLSWIALKGWDSIDFQHPDGTRKLYSPEGRGDPNLGVAAQGKTCPLYKWSNYSIKNILVHLRDGKGKSWVASDVDEDYEKQMNSEILTCTIDKRTHREKWIWMQKTGVPNHYFDCECMNVVAASMVGIIGDMGVK